MAKKQTIASEIGSALGAVAVRAEQLIAGNPTIKTSKPTAKRTSAAKHSTTIAPKKVVGKVAEIVVTQEAIAEQAYLYWEARGYQGGDPVSDWTRAEEELKQRAFAAV
jgi:hypothetical protein